MSPEPIVSRETRAPIFSATTSKNATRPGQQRKQPEGSPIRVPRFLRSSRGPAPQHPQTVSAGTATAGCKATGKEKIQCRECLGSPKPIKERGPSGAALDSERVSKWG